jgi:ABC-type spermidine/putrescine transport system permease subunit I
VRRSLVWLLRSVLLGPVAVFCAFWAFSLDWGTAEADASSRLRGGPGEPQNSVLLAILTAIAAVAFIGTLICLVVAVAIPLAAAIKRLRQKLTNKMSKKEL